MNTEIKKNILDLQFQKYLVIASTSVIISFTYFVGIIIAILTKQIILNDFIRMGAVFVISVGIISICLIFFLNSIFHIRKILKCIKKL